MALLVVLFIAVIISVLTVRISAHALMRTGMSREMAEFQAQSAFTTVGFTTSEAESVVNHPVRRRIIMLLMLMGNIGLVTVLGSGIVSFIAVAEQDSIATLLIQIGFLLLGLAIIWLVFSSHFVDRLLNAAVDWAMGHWSELEARDYVDLLHLTEGYTVTELVVDAEDWLVGHTLEALRLADVGVNVLAIVRENGEFIGAPVGNTRIDAKDQLIIYGAHDAIDGLDEHRQNAEHGKQHMAAVTHRRDLKRVERERKDLEHPPE